MRIDLALNVKLTPQKFDFDEGAHSFLKLLRVLERLPNFNMGWMAHNFRLWHQEKEYLKSFFDSNLEFSPDGKNFDIKAVSEVFKETDHLLYRFEYNWNDTFIDTLSGEIYRPHPDYGLQPQHFINMIDVITRWKRPQHLRFGPFIYMRDHHPLDRAREGIGWMGWVPFALNPSDVPEAELVRQTNGGTLIVTQMEFWQAWPQHPQYSKAAIERAQEVEIRLNLLGVLPTVVELQRGDWGQ